jgi:hypothetical protein
MEGGFAPMEFGLEGHLLNLVRFLVSAGFGAFAISRRYLFVIAQKDLNQWISHPPE